MPTPPEIPQAALDAAAADLHERSTLSMHRAQELSGQAIRAALPHLLPGLFVTDDGRGDATLWEGNEDVTERPQPLMYRTDDNARLFDLIAALLPAEEG
jgi:hypothetical protein